MNEQNNVQQNGSKQDKKGVKKSLKMLLTGALVCTMTLSLASCAFGPMDFPLPMLQPSVISSAMVASESSIFSFKLVFIQDIPLAMGLGFLPSS